MPYFSRADSHRCVCAKRHRLTLSVFPVVSSKSASISFAGTGHVTFSALACAKAFPEVL